jgi:hypothetical protein
MARGTGMALVTALVSGVIIALASSCVRVISIPQDWIAPILAVMAPVTAAAVPASASPTSCLPPWP